MQFSLFVENRGREEAHHLVEDGGSREIYTLAYIIFDYLCVLKLYPISLIAMYTRIYNIKSPKQPERSKSLWLHWGVSYGRQREKCDKREQC